MSLPSKNEVHIMPASCMKEFDTDVFIVEGC